MISEEKIDELFNTISNDLLISRFCDESEISFRNRLTYSAISKWILTLFSDRDFEESDDNKISELFSDRTFEQRDKEKISKSHVTISALNVLNSYKKIDTGLNNYFINDKDFINFIENTYLRLGYVKNGMFSFKSQDKVGRIRVADKSLVIDANSKNNKVRGLGLWGEHTDLDISLDDYLLININAEEYTLKMISQLKYDQFDSEHGKCEIYDIEKHMWAQYSEELAKKFKYSVVKIDGGLDYKIIKTVDGIIYAGTLPDIYTKKSNDLFFNHDVWRLILGICSLCENRAKCYLFKNKDYIKIKFHGFILPSLEDAILRCICWPLKDCLNVSVFVTDISMKNALIELLSKFCVDIIEA